jgi:dUTP pyrophosphatase
VNGQGIIDADYYDNPGNEGHILIAIVNHGTALYGVKRGERVAQGIFYKFLQADGDTTTADRQGGIGSTGK